MGRERRLKGESDCECCAFGGCGKKKSCDWHECASHLVIDRGSEVGILRAALYGPLGRS